MKPLALLLALTLLVGCAIGGTIAWLTAKTDPVQNTFTPSDIDITLEETGTDAENKKSFKMVPGHTIAKDPKATVVTGSEDCYLFVEITESANFDEFMTYVIAEGWTKLGSATDNNSEVYYRIFDSKDSSNTNAMGTAYSVLANDQVQVKDTVTKQNMNNLTANNYPSLTFKAYAVQLYKDNTTQFTAEEAWANHPTT